MVSGQKKRVVYERSTRPHVSDASSSCAASSSCKATRSARGDAGTERSTRYIRDHGYDGNADPDDLIARDPARSRVIVLPGDERLNYDLGVMAGSVARATDITTKLPARQPPSKMGQACKIGLNTFRVEKFPENPIYQYDVVIGNGVEKRGLMLKVWNSKAVQNEVGQNTVFDGNKLAWSRQPIVREIKLIVDLDADEGNKAYPRDNKHRIIIRQTNEVKFNVLMAHLSGRASFDNTCLEAINFADHLLRMTPSTKYTAIKRAFFQRGEKRFDLGGGVEAFKGVYQSLRLVHPGRLSVNLDVANGAFWTAQTFIKAAVLCCGARHESDLVVLLQNGGEKGRAGKELKKMRKLHVIAVHRGQTTKDEFVIEKFIFVPSKQYQVQVKDPSGNDKTMSLYDYFAGKYQIRLNYPDLPLCKMTRGKNIVLPMEVLALKENQRYQYKMDERQTLNMTKFAVTAPPERYNAIQHGLNMLSWGQDPMLKHYGLRITNAKTVVDARLLPAPKVKFSNGEANPGISGHWDPTNKKFLTPNVAPLKSWAMCIISGRRGGKPNKTVIEEFTASFVKTYIDHGGKVENKRPAMLLSSTEDVGKWVTDTWNAAGNQSQMRPQILVFILPDKNSTVYGHIKRSCECRYGVVSQCMQYAQVAKNQPQYISNVCMKFNSKLGGVTCRAIGANTSGPTGIFTVPSMVIGADVSHGAPGTQDPSVAAMTVSLDKLATRYAAICQTNGIRREMIDTTTINTQLKSMVKEWMAKVGGGRAPRIVFYLRDGVSESQYQHVLQQEVADMKHLLKGADPTGSTKFVVLIGSKRHHVRFFPDKGDRNGNAHPGTLVETGVTSPFENDFYLQSHSAKEGTARPVHYYCLLNEPGLSNYFLQTMLYEQSYQSVRSSTPLSIHPAIQYAHVAAKRAIPHLPKWAVSSCSTPSTNTIPRADRPRVDSPTDPDKLMPMPNQGNIVTSMWYV